MARAATKAKKSELAPDRRYALAHEVVLSPTIQGAVAIDAWSKFAGDIDLGELVAGMRERSKKVLAGDLQPVEAMLFSQAMALETIFTSLSRRAVSPEYLKQFQAYLTLALKAQAQCRATLEALAEIKNPRQVLIAKQANVANGPQQVNNGPALESGPVRAGERAHAGQTTSLQNGLLIDDRGTHTSEERLSECHSKVR